MGMLYKTNNGLIYISVKPSMLFSPLWLSLVPVTDKDCTRRRNTEAAQWLSFTSARPMPRRPTLIGPYLTSFPGLRRLSQSSRLFSQSLTESSQSFQSRQGRGLHNLQPPVPISHDSIASRDQDSPRQPCHGIRTYLFKLRFAQGKLLSAVWESRWTSCAARPNWRAFWFPWSGRQ